MVFKKVYIRVGSFVYHVGSDEFATVTICNDAVLITHKRRNQQCKHFWFTPPSNPVRNSISDTRKQNINSISKNLLKIFESVLDSKIQEALGQDENSSQCSLSALQVSGPHVVLTVASHSNIIPPAPASMIDKNPSKTTDCKETLFDKEVPKDEDWKKCQTNLPATLLETGLLPNTQDKKPKIKEVSTQELTRSRPQENVQVTSLDAIASSSQASSSVVTTGTVH